MANLVSLSPFNGCAGCIRTFDVFATVVSEFHNDKSAFTIDDGST